MTTVREIAEFAGVSKSTVSLVLNNKPGVSDQMRRTVLDAMNQLEAVAMQVPLTATPDLAERTGRLAERGVGNNTLSIVVLHPPVLSSSYVFSEVLQGIQSAAEAYNVQLRLVVNDPDAGEGHVSHLYFSDPNLRPDGVLVFGAQRHEPLLEAAQELDVPCVVLGRQASKYDVSGVGRDEAIYALEATQYLIELGHRAIAFVGGDERSYDYLDNRLSGYENAMQQAGLVVLPEWVAVGDCEEATRSVLDCDNPVTAIIFVNDTCARLGLPVIGSLRLRIPDDLSVISFDDTDVAQNFDPPITSVRYRRYEEGQWAVKMLIDQIRFPFIDRVQTIFRAELIKRASCATPPE